MRAAVAGGGSFANARIQRRALRSSSAPGLRVQRARIATTSTRAVLNDEPPRGEDTGDEKSPPKVKGADVSSTEEELEGFQQSVMNLLERYDWVSAGMGALLGTSFFVSRGQNPSTALGIALVATIIAVAADEIIRDSEQGNL